MTRTASRQDAEVLAAAAAGDEIAFRRLIATHHEDMRRVAAYVAHDHAIAEDAAQAAWVIAWKKLGNVRDEAHLRPWLVSVAANEAKRLLRKRRRRAQVEVALDPMEDPGGIDPATGIAEIDDIARALRLSANRVDRMLESERGFTRAEYNARHPAGKLGEASRGEEPSSPPDREA